MRLLCHLGDLNRSTELHPSVKTYETPGLSIVLSLLHQTPLPNQTQHPPLGCDLLLSLVGTQQGVSIVYLNISTPLVSVRETKPPL